MQPALDRNGRSSFHLLQGYGKAQHTPLVYYAFDLLSSDGADLRSQPFIEPSKLLATLLENPPENIKFSEELTGAKEELLQVAKHFELEDLIAKRPDSLNEPGRRSGARVKIKLTQQQEFVIGGYAPSYSAEDAAMTCFELSNALRDITVESRTCIERFAKYRQPRIHRVGLRWHNQMISRFRLASQELEASAKPGGRVFIFQFA